ncbi:MAG: NAD(+)/NADH kinase [Spirochaetales bacterium]|nr:NAD(+)/NADH kinase [Spirochaetales bacterium]
MKPVIKRVILVVNLMKDGASALAEEVRAYLEEEGIEVRLHSFKGKPESFDFSGADLAVSLGGDGTVLYCAREIYGFGTPILAVNLGNFGFITEVSRDEWKDAFSEYREGRLSLSERLLVTLTLQRQEEEMYHLVGLNDIVINNQGLSKLIRFRVYCNGTPIGVYRADGIILATPTGSTAYSAAAGGPILSPEMDAFILNPICPFTLSNRPLVVPGNSSIEIELDLDQKTAILLTVDGQDTLSLLPGDRIQVRRALKKALIIRSDKRNFYEVLRSKLNWTGGPDA